MGVSKSWEWVVSFPRHAGSPADGKRNRASGGSRGFWFLVVEMWSEEYGEAVLNGADSAGEGGSSLRGNAQCQARTQAGNCGRESACTAPVYTPTPNPITRTPNPKNQEPSASPAPERRVSCRMPSANPPSETQTILGIEGGGTKTEWMLFQGRAAPEALLAQGALPAANLQLISDEGLARLFSVLPREASQVGVFLAGCATEEDRARLHRVAAQAWPNARLALGSDRDSAMAAAFGDDDGIVVIAGTGAAVHGRKGGRVEKAGGWGQILGDRGGGYNLAVQGLRLVLTHYDLNQSITPLAEEILRAAGLNRLSDLVGWAMTADKMSVAMLAPAIFHAAKFGEPEMLATRAVRGGCPRGFHARGGAAPGVSEGAGAAVRRAFREP